jgi:PadR family transcriptional regulator, regulatory protein PadR
MPIDDEPILPDRTVRVLLAFMDDPDARHYAYELSRAAGMATGAIYPHLIRLERLGLVTSGWDDHPAPGRRHQPPHRRRWYALTDEGRRMGGRHAARQRLQQWQGWRRLVAEA